MTEIMDLTQQKDTINKKVLYDKEEAKHECIIEV